MLWQARVCVFLWSIFIFWSIDTMLLNYIFHTLCTHETHSHPIDLFTKHSLFWMACCYPLIVLNCFTNKRIHTHTHSIHLIKREPHCWCCVSSSSSSKIITFFCNANVIKLSVSVCVWRANKKATTRTKWKESASERTATRVWVKSNKKKYGKKSSEEKKRCQHKGSKSEHISIIPAIL